MTQWTGPWKGGRTYADRDGQPRYVIEKMRHGRRYNVVLPARTVDPEAELALFLRNPDAYAQRAEQTGLLPEEAVVITAEEIRGFVQYLSTKQRSAAYVKGVASYLREWANALNGRDLRYLTVDECYKLLTAWEKDPNAGRTADRKGKRRTGARRYRIISLQTFSRWLVKRQRLKLGENVAALLEAPKAATARSRGQRAYTVEQVHEWYSKMGSQRMRDCICLGAKYAMHQTEVARIARGDVEIEEVNTNGIAAIITFLHKNQRDHRLAIDAQALAAVRRLIALGRAPTANRMNYWTHRTAALVKGGKPVHPKFLRHFATTLGKKAGQKVYPEGEQGGLTSQEMGFVTNHRSALMQKDHYDHSIFMMVLPLRLYHPEDPVEISVADRGEAAALTH